MKKILIPVDSAEPCDKTVIIAKDLALKYESELIIFHVNQNYDATIAILPADFEKEMRESSNRLIEEAASYFDETGIKVSTKVIKGDPASAILDFAKQVECDLIIMCSHGHNALQHFLIGSVTNKVVHYATVPVLIVK